MGDPNETCGCRQGVEMGLGTRWGHYVLPMRGWRAGSPAGRKGSFNRKEREAWP